MDESQQTARDCMLVRLGAAGLSPEGARLALRGHNGPLPDGDAGQDALVAELVRAAPDAYKTVPSGLPTTKTMEDARTAATAERDRLANRRTLDSALDSGGFLR